MPLGRDQDVDIDHDHVTEQVRGLVCKKCNTGIGLLGDTIEGVERALAYLGERMPYIRKERTDTVQLPSNPDYHVEMKDRASYGDKMAAQRAMLQISQVDLAMVPPEKAHMVEADIESGRGVLTEIEIDAFFKTLLHRLIVSWNLDAEDGQIVPITPQAIEMLESEDGEFLMTHARRRLNGRRPADERPFDGPSPQPSSDTKSLTETPSEL